MGKLKDRFLVLYPDSKPMLGMRSAVNPAALPDGLYYNIQNFRASRYNVTARNGCTRLATALVANASYRGSWAGYVNGSYTIFAACKVSSVIRIYQFTGAGGVEVTSAGTRLSTDAFVEFAPVFDKGITFGSGSNLGSQEGVLVSNGTDNPILLYFSGGSWTSVIVQTPTGITNQFFYSQAFPAGWFQLNNAANTTYTNSGINLVQADTGGTVTNEVALTFNAAAAAGDTSINVLSSTSYYDSGALRFDDARQFHILCEDNAADTIWNYLNLAISDNTPSYKTIYTYNQDSQPIITPTNVSGVYLASFDLGPYQSIASTLTAIDRYKLTVGRTIAADRTAKILAFMVGGNVDASAESVISYLLSTSRAEGPIHTCIKRDGPQAFSFGGSESRRVTLPVGEGLFFTNKVTFPGGSGTTITNDVIVYRKDPGDEAFFASAFFASGTTANQNQYDNRLSQDKAYGRIAPSAFTIVPPKAKTLARGANRLYAGCISGETQNMYVSDDGYPMRFVSQPRDSDGDGVIDPDSGTVLSFSGELIQKIIPMPGSILGSSPMAVMTNQNTWRVEGFDSLSLSRATLMTTYGTMYPRSVASHKGSMYWLDSEKQPRMVSYGADAVAFGVNKIDDQFESGDPTNAVGIIYKEGYRLAIRANGGSVNKLVLYWDSRMSEWFTDVYTDPDWAGYIVEDRGGSNGRRLIGITETMEFFELEKIGKLNDDQKSGSSTDAISCLLETGNIHADLGQSFMFEQPTILCDVMSGVTITFTYIDLLSSAPASGNSSKTMDIGTTRDFDQYMWRTLMNGPGIDTHAMRFRVSGSFVPGKNITGLGFELDEKGLGSPEVLSS